MWAVDRGEADEKGEWKQKQKFSQKVMVFAQDLFKMGYTIGYSGQKYHRSRQMHQGSLASCHQVWKQGF